MDQYIGFSRNSRNFTIYFLVFEIVVTNCCVRRGREERGRENTMDLLPKTYAEFRSREYWDSFFRKRKEKEFEWYGDFTHIKAPLTATSSTNDQILVIGCGNRFVPLCFPDISLELYLYYLSLVLCFSQSSHKSLLSIFLNIFLIISSLLSLLFHLLLLCLVLLYLLAFISASPKLMLPLATCQQTSMMRDTMRLPT